MEGRVLTVRSVILVIIHVASMVLGNEINRCDQTPHPGQCKTLLMTRNPTKKPIRSTTQFLKLSVERTLDVTMKAKRDTYPLRAQFESKQREKEAWEDCMALYDQTIHRLNQTALCSRTVCSKSDVQAWLSNALTNLDTCRKGMSELGISSHPLESRLQRITNDVINALAINKGMKTKRIRFNASRLVKLATNASSIGIKADVVVAQDGSGNFKTIQEAVNGAGERSMKSPRYVIHVKQGVYSEYVTVGEKSNNIMITGDGIGKTIITGDKSKGGGFTTYKSATVVVEGDGFAAQDITIRNTAGPENLQAVALRTNSDMSVYYRCSFEGYQDTLYVHSGRQFYRECDIYGTVDFIFGYATAVLQNCRIFARQPPKGVNTITAHSRISQEETTGIVIHNSVITAAPGTQLADVKTYLGRPWAPYSRTVVMGTVLDPLIHPKGWIEWDNKTTLNTMYYAEYQNSGPGSVTENRVDWAGFHVISDVEEARQFTLPIFLEAASWLPKTQVPFTFDL